MNNSIPILHDTVNGMLYIVQTNIIGLGQLDLPVMLRVQACKREVVSDHQWSFKGCLLRQEWLHFPETVRCIVHIQVFHLHWISSSRQGF